FASDQVWEMGACLSERVATVSPVKTGRTNTRSPRDGETPRSSHVLPPPPGGPPADRYHCKGPDLADAPPTAAGAEVEDPRSPAGMLPRRCEVQPLTEEPTRKAALRRTDQSGMRHAVLAWAAGDGPSGTEEKRPGSRRPPI